MGITRATVSSLIYDEDMWKTSEGDLLEDPVPPKACFIFLEDRDLYKQKYTEGDRRKILAPFNVPGYLANQVCTDINGYCGCRSSFDANDVLVDLSVWFRCLTKVVLRPEEHDAPDGKRYWWYEMGVFARWSHPGVCRVLCVGTPPVLRQQLKTALDESPSLELRDPFAMMLPLFDQIIKLYDDSAWRVRDQVRAIEKNRASHAADFVAMHDISRHAGHLVEVHAATVETMESLLHRQRAIHDGLSSLDKTHKEQSQEYLEFQLQIIKSLQRRSLSIQERINSEITLVLCCSHGVLQTANAWQAYNIMATQDNTVMKSIALLTVTFLPATFISALFSTTFFSFAEESWNVSKKFWIYWAVAIPSTLFVLVVWWLGLGGTCLRNRWLGPS